MRFIILRIQWILIFVLAGTFLSGCIPTNPAIATRFYVLTPVDSTTPPVRQPDPNRPLSVEIATLHLPQYLEKPQIVTRSGINQLELAEYHQWGGNLRKNMIRVMARNLSHLLATPEISMAPFRPLAPPDFTIEMEVMQYEADAQGQVRLSAQWRIFQGTGKKNMTTRMTDLTRQATGLDFEHTVLAMSSLLGELSRIISQEILILVPVHQKN